MKFLGIEERVQNGRLKRMRSAGLDPLIEPFQKEAAEDGSLVRFEVTVHVEFEVLWDLLGPTGCVLRVLVVLGQASMGIDAELRQDFGNNADRTIERQGAAYGTAACEIATSAALVGGSTSIRRALAADAAAHRGGRIFLA